MNVKKAVSETITIGDQPDVADLPAFRDEGYVGVVNLRTDGEPEQPLGTVQEGEEVRALGLDYLHVPVGGAPLDGAGVKALETFLDEHAGGKTLVHCRKGGRAAALVALYFAEKHGWGVDDVASEAEAKGLKLEGGLRTLVEGYLRAKSSE